MFCVPYLFTRWQGITDRRAQTDGGGAGAGMAPFRSVLSVLKRQAMNQVAAATALSRGGEGGGLTAAGSGCGVRDYSPLFENIIRPTLNHLTDYMAEQFEQQQQQQIQVQHELERERRQGGISGGAAVDASPTHGNSVLGGPVFGVGSQNRGREEEALEAHRIETQDIVTVLIAALTALDLQTKGALTSEFASILCAYMEEEEGYESEEGSGNDGAEGEDRP